MTLPAVILTHDHCSTQQRHHIKDLNDKGINVTSFLPLDIDGRYLRITSEYMVKCLVEQRDMSTDDACDAVVAFLMEKDAASEAIVVGNLTNTLKTSGVIVVTAKRQSDEMAVLMSLCNKQFVFAKPLADYDLGALTLKLLAPPGQGFGGKILDTTPIAESDRAQCYGRAMAYGHMLCGSVWDGAREVFKEVREGERAPGHAHRGQEEAAEVG